MLRGRVVRQLLGREEEQEPEQLLVRQLQGQLLLLLPLQEALLQQQQQQGVGSLRRIPFSPLLVPAEAVQSPDEGKASLQQHRGRLSAMLSY